jgi:trigger factor
MALFDWLKKKDDGGVATAEKPAPKATAPQEEALSLKVKLKEKKGCQARLEVTIPSQDVERETEITTHQVQKRVRLPGFRAGKAPLDLVKQNFAHAVLEETVNRLLKDSAHEALRKEGLTAVAPLSVDHVDYKPGKALRYELKAECAPEVTLKPYKGLSLLRKTKTVVDQDVAKKLDEIRESHARLVPSTAETVGETHFVAVTYDGAVDGVPVPGGKAENQLIDMAAPQALAGFTAGLKGQKAGETRSLPVPFPADHPNASLAGKTAEFKTTVLEIKDKQLPALDDEFAKDLGAASLEDLRSRVKANLEADLARNVRQDLEKQVIDGLLEINPFDVPPSQVKDRAEHLTEEIRRYLERRGASAADWQDNAETFREKNLPEAERQIRLSYILVHIATAEKIVVTGADVDEMIRKTVEAAGPSRREEIRTWAEGRRDSIQAQMNEEKLFSFLINAGVVTDAPA